VARLRASDRLAIALVGCGGMGGANLRSLLRRPDVTIVAVCDPDRDRREALRAEVDARAARDARSGHARGCVAVGDHRPVVERPDVDAVVIASPDHWHARQSIDALRAGKDVYCEKPLSRTVAEGRAVADAVAHSGRVLQVGSQQRSDARFHRACELVRNGVLGRVRRITCALPEGIATGNHPPEPVPEGFDYAEWLGPAPMAPYCSMRTHYNFRYQFDYAGGKITDWGAHHIDIAQWALGTTGTGPVRVAGDGTFPEDGLFDTALRYRVTATYADGTELIVRSLDEAHPNGVRFEGDDGWLFVSRGAIESGPADLLRTELGSARVRLPRSRDHHGDFLEAVRTRRAPIAPAEHAHRSITIAHLGNVAMKLGRPIRWDPERELVPGDPGANTLLAGLGPGDRTT